MEMIRGLRPAAATPHSEPRRQIQRTPLDLASAGVDPEVLLASVLASVLGRYLSYDEVVLGVEAGVEGSLFIELPVAVPANRTLDQVIDQIALARAVEAPSDPPDSSSPPGAQLLVHAVVCAPDLLEAEAAGPWTLLPKNVEFDLGNADCAFAWSPDGEDSELLLCFDSNRLEAERIEVLLASVAEAARHAVLSRARGEEVAISQLPLVPASMRTKIVEEFNDTRAPLSDTETVVDLIERQIAANPGNTACVFEEESLTYAELGERSRGLAAALGEQGVRKGDLVGVLVGNSLELPSAELACLMLGAVFIPMDEMWPAERLEKLLRDTDPRAIVATEAKLPEEFRDRLVECNGSLPEAPKSEVGEEILQTDLAYGIPTSGSTGPPKCAMNIHRGLLNRFEYMTRRYKSGSHEVVLQNSRPAFDSSLWQLLWPLTNGATVVVPRPSKQLDLAHTISLIHRHQVTMTDFVPSVFNTLVRHLEQEPGDVERLSSLKNLLIGGEEINKDYCRRFRALLPDVGLTNTYGPTEASIGMVFYEVNVEEDEIPIGHPIDNTFAVVLDEEMRLVPPGVVGELYIGGVCLGAGYLGDPERTAKVWVPNPFDDLDGDELYRTGDLVHQRPDGRLYFLGRSDGQVKIAGIRIELAEIEHMLTRHPSVDRAVLCTEETAAGDRLVAYVVASGEPTAAELKSHLEGLLPKQAIPGRFVHLDDLPMTHNGKLDRKKLPLSASPATEPRGESAEEIGLWEIWRDLLGTDDFTVDDDFFLLGGDSLLVTHLVFDIADRFETRIPLRAVYDAPTVRQLAGVLSGDTPIAEETSREQVLELAESDCLLLNDLPTANAALRGRPEAGAVLMTGATGFVGVHIVERLMARTDAEVLFLARDGDDAIASERLQGAMTSFGLWDDTFAARLRPVGGDLQADALGLTEARWASLVERVGTIVNCGAMVDFLHDYRRHRPVNVGGFAQLVRLAADSGNTGIHQISSISAGDPDRPPLDGYGLSKWVAERLAERAIARGYDVAVHRLGEVMPHSRTGVPNTRALSYMLIRSCLLLGLYPSELVALDYSPADWVANAIVDSIVAERTARGAHDVCHPARTTLEVIVECAREEGLEVQPVSGAAFHRGLQARCELDADRTLHSLRSLFTAALQEQEDQGDIDRMLSGLFVSPEDAPGRRIGAQIGGPAAAWPEIDADVLRPMLAEAFPHSRSRAYSS